MASTYMDSVIKEKLKLQHSTLNPAQLKRDNAELQDKIYDAILFSPNHLFLLTFEMG
jgi:hypothetical protein